MREIKFRVWDVQLNRFRRSDIIGPVNSIWGMKIDRGVFSVSSTDTLIYQQYTGLKDINGKEIYEGDILKETHYDYTGRLTDIVRHPAKMVGYDYRGIVYWTEGCPCNTKDSTDAYALLGFRTFPLDTTVGQVIGNSITRNCEVLGNMYENPELIVHGPDGPKYTE